MSQTYYISITDHFLVSDFSFVRIRHAPMHFMTNNFRSVLRLTINFYLVHFSVMNIDSAMFFTAEFPSRKEKNSFIFSFYLENGTKNLSQNELEIYIYFGIFCF